jgi:hypothetical protein
MLLAPEPMTATDLPSKSSVGSYISISKHGFPRLQYNHADGVGDQERTQAAVWSNLPLKVSRPLMSGHFQSLRIPPALITTSALCSSSLVGVPGDEDLETRTRHLPDGSSHVAPTTAELKVIRG